MSPTHSSEIRWGSFGLGVRWFAAGAGLVDSQTHASAVLSAASHTVARETRLGIYAN